MALLAHQSPLSILGLKYGTITTKDIMMAVKLAKLHCHPDKPRNPAIPNNYYALVDAAVEYLLETKGSITKFKGYPVLFFPQRSNIGKPEVYQSYHSSISSYYFICRCGKSFTKQAESCSTPGCDSSKRQVDIFSVCHCGEVVTVAKRCSTQGCDASMSEEFTICWACKTAIPKSSYHSHISNHTDLCELCNEVLDDEHYSEYHPEAVCRLCSTSGVVVDMHSHIKTHTVADCNGCRSTDTAELLDHITKEHFDCPLCKQECGDGFPDHLKVLHYFRQNKDCKYCSEDSYAFNEIPLHLLSSNSSDYHQWTICPRCNLHIAQGWLWNHLRRDHPSFEMCMFCPRTEEQFAADKEHAQAHILEICSLCLQECQSWQLPLHQQYEHKWLLCKYCSRVEATPEELREHEKEDHRFFRCPECSEKLLEEQQNAHLHQRHSWPLCPWCKMSFSEDTIRPHMEESHPPKTKCSICIYEDTIGGLKQHMRDRHGWKICLSCDQAAPADTVAKDLQCNACIAKDLKSTDTALSTEDISKASAEHLPEKAEQELNSVNQLYVSGKVAHPKPEQQDLPGAKRRKYNRTKCPRCRRDKQKCERLDEQPCKRCKHYNYSCEASIKL